MPKRTTTKKPTKGKAKAKGKPKKDPNAPKRGKSAWIYFTVEQRPVEKAKHPDLSMTEITKKLGERWRKMDEEDKAPYQELAVEDKERYDKEKAAYEKGKDDDDDDDDDEEESDSESS